MSDAAIRYKNAHWGYPHKRVIEVDDPELDEVAPELTEMGKLVELDVRVGEARGKIAFPPGGAHLAFTPDTETLYVVQSAKQRRATFDAYWVDDAPTYPLHEIAQVAGGRRREYPDVECQAIGTVHYVVYRTPKKGDARGPTQPDEYIHKLGEEGGKKPWLAIDEQGRLWFAGGSYTVPDEGITD